jgi:hypothetical protein
MIVTDPLQLHSLCNLYRNLAANSIAVQFGGVRKNSGVRGRLFHSDRSRKSNIFVNKPNETKYFYQDLDAEGRRLNGSHRYTVTFTKDQTPPMNGFWSLTLLQQHHFFEPNAELAAITEKR